MNLKSKTGETCEKTCCWCVIAVIVALTLLALTWTVILASNTSVLGMIKIMNKVLLIQLINQDLPTIKM